VHLHTVDSQAKDAINAILKPLEVLTRPVHKQAAADAAAAAGTGEQAADTHAATDQGAAAAAAAPAAGAAATPAATPSGAGRAPGTASRHRGGAAIGQPAAVGSAQAAAASAGGGAPPAAAAAAQPAAGGSGGGNAPMHEDRQQLAAGEEAAGPAALAAAGRFVPGGVPQGGGQAEGALIDNLMQQMVDIEVDLNGDDSDELEDESEEDDLSSEEEGGSDEHMQQRMAGEEVSSSAMDIEQPSSTSCGCCQCYLKVCCLHHTRGMSLSFRGPRTAGLLGASDAVLEAASTASHQPLASLSVSCIAFVATHPAWLHVSHCLLTLCLCCCCCSVRLVTVQLVAAVRGLAWMRTPASPRTQTAAGTNHTVSGTLPCCRGLACSLFLAQHMTPVCSPLWCTVDLVCRRCCAAGGCS
jgi:hypothetical protein